MHARHSRAIMSMCPYQQRVSSASSVVLQGGLSTPPPLRDAPRHLNVSLETCQGYMQSNIILPEGDPH